MHYRFDMDPADVDDNGICASQTPLAGGSLTINGALTSGGTFDIHLYGGDSNGIGGRQIAFVFAADETGRTFTITGTDQNGDPQTSTVAGSTGTVEDTVYYRTITDISVDAATAGALEVGTVDEIISRTVAIDDFFTAATIAVLSTTGTCQFDIDETFDDVLDPHNTFTPVWYSIQSNKSADLVGSLTRCARAVRLKFDSYTSGAELQFYVAN